MSIEFYEAEDKDIDAIVEMMETARQQAENPDWYVIDGRDFVERHLKEEGFILKAVEGEELLAFLIVRFPGGAEDNLGVYLNLSEEEGRRVAHMESVAVCEKARGKGLQKRLMEEGEKRLGGMGYRYLMATVHPGNTYSHNNFLKLGYEDAAVVEKYDGLPRIVLKKER